MCPRSRISVQMGLVAAHASCQVLCEQLGACQVYKAELLSAEGQKRGSSAAGFRGSLAGVRLRELWRRWPSLLQLQGTLVVLLQLQWRG